MAFQLWYTNYFIDFNNGKTVDPKTIAKIEELGTVSASGDFSSWHVKSQLHEDDFNHHLNKLLTEQTELNSDDVTITKGINGGPLSML